MRILLTILTLASSLVLAVGASDSVNASGGETKIEISRRLAFRGSEGYRVSCSDKNCQLIRLKNGYEVRTVLVSKSQMEKVAAQFLSSMRRARRPASRGQTPLLFWEVSSQGKSFEGMISQEEMESGEWDRGAVINYNGLEMKFMSYLVSPR